MCDTGQARCRTLWRTFSCGKCRRGPRTATRSPSCGISWSSSPTTPPSPASPFPTGAPPGKKILFNFHFKCSLIRVRIDACRVVSLAVSDRALTPDLTRDYDERTSLTMYRQFQALVSGVIFTFAHSIIIDVRPPALASTSALPTLALVVD